MARSTEYILVNHASVDDRVKRGFIRRHGKPVGRIDVSFYEKNHVLVRDTARPACDELVDVGGHRIRFIPT